MATRHIRVYLICLLTVFVSTVASARLWDPLLDATPNLIALYDASDSDTVITNTSTGNNVLEWYDKSANGYHMKSGGNRPAYGTTTINGLNAIDYDSTFDQMFTNLAAGIDCTNVCIISAGEGDAGDWPAFGAVMNTNKADKIDARMQSDATQGRCSPAITLDGTGSSLSTVWSTNLAELVPCIYAVWYDGSETACRANGGDVSGANAGAPDGATFTIERIQCGRESNTPRNHHGEMIVLNTANIDTIELVEGYLAWKWGTQGKLPNDHPYKDAPPEVPPDGTLFIFE